MNVQEVAEKALYPFEETYQGLQLFKAIDPAYYRQIRALFDRVRQDIFQAMAAK